MKKVLVLKDEKTGMYFTNDYDCWWSRNILDACKFGDIAEVDNIIGIRMSEYENPFKDTNFIEILEFYKIIDL